MKLLIFAGFLYRSLRAPESAHCSVWDTHGLRSSQITNSEKGPLTRRPRITFNMAGKKELTTKKDCPRWQEQLTAAQTLLCP